MRNYILTILFSAATLCAAAEPLFIGDTKFTVCKFNSEIKYVDFGSPDLTGEILSHKNMLSLQALMPLEQETTLSVVTANGKYHAFTVKYEPINPQLVWTEEGGAAKPDTLQFSTLKTTHFISGRKISDIVTGSSSLIAEHAENIGNIVKAKALDADFAESSITLVDAEGAVFPYVVVPNENPAVVDVYLNSESQSAAAIFTDASINDIQMAKIGEVALSLPAQVTNIGVSKQKMSFALSGLYSYDDVMMFCVNLENNNLIDYEVDFIKCYIRDKKRSKNITVQEDEITPIYIHYPEGQDQALLKGGKKMSAVLFFRRFTIPQKRILSFEVFERNGGRHLQFTMTDKELLKASQLQLKAE